MEELEEAKKKREADPSYLLGPMYRDYEGNGYNYDHIQSTLGFPYYPNYRDAEPPFYYNQPFYNEDPFEEQELDGRWFLYWSTT